MSTISSIFAKLFPLFGRVKVGGTISTLSPNDEYPTHIANLGYGGLHAYDSLADLASEIPTGRMQIGMMANVKQFVKPDGTVIKRTSYVLEKLLPVGVANLGAIPNYDLSEYWKVVSVADDYIGAFESQYAPNIDILTNTVDNNGGQPPFPGKAGGGVKLSQSQYNSGSGYWVTNYNSTLGHVWQRQRFADSPNTNWGIPVKISGESYASGDYINNLFLRSITTPDTPSQFINGLANNSPAGWFDIPPLLPTTSGLWLTKAQKDAYGQLKSPWSTPIQIINNPLLVRYNEVATPNPNSVAYVTLDLNGWVPIYDPLIHKYMATRQSSGAGVYTAWTVIKIADESGEYIDYIYKAFDLSEVANIIQHPLTYVPTGEHPLNWADTPFTVSSVQRLFISSARKFITGELSSIWSDPTPFSGDDTILPLVVSKGGDEFKTDTNSTPNTVAPAQIELQALLYRGTTLLTPDSYRWKKIYNGGQLANVVLGSLNKIVILPADVIGKAIFEVTQTLQGMVYVTDYSILDISDGIDAKSLILTANSQIITRKTDGSRLPSFVLLKALSSNMSDEPNFKWFKRNLGGVETPVLANGAPYLGDSLAVNYVDFNVIPEITYRVQSVDTGGGLTPISDSLTVYQVEEASNGAPAVVMILSNESHTLVQDQLTNLIDFVGANTRVKIMEGNVDVTNTWVIRKTDSTGVISSTTYKPGSTTDIATDSTAGLGTVPIQLTAFPITDSAGFVTIVATKGLVSLTKQFSLAKIVDPVGSIILDIDATPNGYAFSPVTQSDKTLTATLYLDGTPLSLTTGFQWALDTIVQPNNNNIISVSANQVNFNLTVTCRVVYQGAYYSRTINLTDVKDAKGLGIRYTTRNTDGSADGLGNPISDNDKPLPAIAYNSTGYTGTGFVGWSIDPTNAVFMSIRKADDPLWGSPIRIRGERGDQGAVGNFVNNIFKWAATIPPTPTGNPIPSGWSDSPPPLVANAALWMSIGEVTTATTNVPSQIVSPGWSTPTQVSGTPGINGAASTVAGPSGRSVQVFVQAIQPSGGIYFDGDIWISQ